MTTALRDVDGRIIAELRENGPQSAPDLSTRLAVPVEKIEKSLWRLYRLERVDEAYCPLTHITSECTPRVMALPTRRHP